MTTYKKMNKETCDQLSSWKHLFYSESSITNFKNIFYLCDMSVVFGSSLFSFFLSSLFSFPLTLLLSSQSSILLLPLSPFSFLFFLFFLLFSFYLSSTFVFMSINISLVLLFFLFFLSSYFFIIVACQCYLSSLTLPYSLIYSLFSSFYPLIRYHYRSYQCYCHNYHLLFLSFLSFFYFLFSYSSLVFINYFLLIYNKCFNRFDKKRNVFCQQFFTKINY